MGRKKLFEIEVYGGKNSCYSTLDQIRGHVSLEFDEDTVIDDLEITLEGKVAVRVEKHVYIWSNAGYLFGDHTFLRISSPLESPILRNNGQVGRGKYYTIPFSFTVPEILLPYACSHETSNDDVQRRTHLLLPPSLGSFKTAGVLFDDLGPKGTKVSYNICVRVRKYFCDGDSVLLRRAQQVRIITKAEEEPPLSIKRSDPYYTLHQEQKVYKRIPTIGKLAGRILADTTQLTSLKLQSSCASAENPSNAIATVSLCYYPADEEEHPLQLGSVSRRLHAFTFFGANPHLTTPRPGDSLEGRSDSSQFVNTTRLANLRIGTVEWVKHGPNPIAEQVERVLSSDMPCTSGPHTQSIDAGNQLSFYTTSLHIPIQLPRYTAKKSKQKLFVPAFTSCFISRAYSLELRLSYSCASGVETSSTSILTQRISISRYIRPNAHLILKIPLQISSSPDLSRQNTIRTSQDQATNDGSNQQAQNFPEELRQQSSGMAGSSQSVAENRTMLTVTERSSVSSQPVATSIPLGSAYEGPEIPSLEQEPPAYSPPFGSRRS